MSFTHTLTKIFVVLTYLNYARACPYAHQLGYGDWPREDDPLNISDDYMCSISYNTYNTDCHRFVSQPPPITHAILDHALNSSIDRTDRYISLDLAVVGNAPAAKQFTDMDRNNYYFESATRYVQETACTSKKTTVRYLPTVQVEKFKVYMMNETVTKVACDAGHVKYPKCSPQYPYRSFDGSCNNLKRPLEGSARDCMSRLLPADYKDGISEFRTSANGSPLPNARILSTNLLGGEDHRPLSKQYNEFHSAFGAFVFLDMGMTLSHDTGLRVTLQSCDHENVQRVDHPQCAGIPVPPNDVIHKTYPNQTCIPFARTIPCARCRLGPRMISNSVTAALDLNSVYGVSIEMSNARRTMVGGQLKSQIIKGEEIFAVERYNATGRFRCFEEKCEPSPYDGRSLLPPTAQLIALLFHRNHNRRARILAKRNPNWSDEQIFQEARRWNIAQYQSCIYNEFVKTLIGPDLLRKFELLPGPSVYRPNVELKSILEFQSSAGRIFHSTISEYVTIIDPKTGKRSKVNIRDSAKIESIFYEGQVDGAFLGLLSTASFAVTPSVPLKTFLYDRPGRTFGLDLAAIDIQRQRDHGIPGYTKYIEYFHNVKVRRWDDFKPFILTKNIEKMKKYYDHVDDVDLYIGMFLEGRYPDIGLTSAKIISLQFSEIKAGNRFFFQHAGNFNERQLKALMQANLAAILGPNTKMQRVPRDAFLRGPGMVITPSVE